MEHHWYATVHTIEVGSPGIVDASSFNIIKRFTGDAFWPVTGLLFKFAEWRSPHPTPTKHHILGEATAFLLAGRLII